VSATDPDGDALQYKYATTAETISGKGKSIVWDLVTRHTERMKFA
jgi:hypothetical protein